MSLLTPISGLVMHLDEPVLVVLLDGTHIYGILRSIDQFENLVLEDSFERHFIDSIYTENILGTQIVQGHSVMLVGPLDNPLDDCPIEGMKKVSLEEFATYVNLSDEEKRNLFAVIANVIVEYNGGKEESFASNKDYSICLV